MDVPRDDGEPVDLDALRSVAPRVAAAIGHVLASPTHKAAAAEVARELASSPKPEGAIAELESLLG